LVYRFHSSNKDRLITKMKDVTTSTTNCDERILLDINPEVIYIYNRLTLYNAIVRGFELKKVCESIYRRTQI